MPLNPPDIKEIKAIVDWVNLTPDVRDLSIKYGDVELVISRDGRSAAPAAPAPVVAAPVAAASAPAAPSSVPSAPAEAAPAASVGADLAGDEVLVKAPMVGVFYASPKPGDPPFVSVGDTVTSSTIVGIVEVMKLMNNLEAKADGTVVRILAENEQAVQYGEPLLVIKRHG